jgi:hypothetical protein
MLLIYGVVDENVDPTKGVDGSYTASLQKLESRTSPRINKHRRLSATTVLCVTSASLWSSGKYAIATYAPWRANSTEPDISHR